ncbi:MAG TPA: CRISPR-associated RAMP protein Csx10 [Chloroflexota bacterium]|nr:CRISPR-associated RAMP protein Csx10 [Chloroflexota bacterium]
MNGSRKRLGVTITLESPLALAERQPDGQSVEGLDYVPGARLRGAAAAVLLAEGACPPAHREANGRCRAADCPVGALFGGPAAAVFGDCLPADAPELLPATAVSCQRVPGFRTQLGPERGHGVFDTLIDRAFWEILQPAGLLYTPRCPEPGCQARVVRYAGCYGRGASGGARSYTAARVPTRVLARAGVDRRTRTTAAGRAYTVPVVADVVADAGGGTRQMAFRGEVLVPDDANGARLADALARVEQLGGGGSRGLGAVRVVTAEVPPPSPLAERLEVFARAVSVRRGQYARLAPLSAASLEGSYFSLDLRADALLRRRGWAPTTVLDADLLRAATGVADPSLTLVRAYAAPAWRGGWNAAWGLPRPTELAAARGSCYLFRTTDLAAWNAALEALEWQGIGLRTAEGYGRVHVCDPFHLVLREQAV